MKTNCLHRRSFLKTAATGAAAALFAPAWAQGAGLDPRAKSRVVRTTRSNVIDTDETINERIVRPMIEETLIALTNKGTIREAWATLIPTLQPKDVIGFKINMLSGQGLVSQPAVVLGLANSLIEAMDINPNNILIWDRTDSELTRHYELNTSSKGIRCYGTLPGRRGWAGTPEGAAAPGYDEGITVDVGPGARVHFSKILSDTCQHLINIPVLKDHGTTGVTLAMKNLYGVIDSPSSCHPNGGDPYIVNLSRHPTVRNKTRLLFADAIFSCYSGGPGGPAQVMSRQLMASLDPVAIDTIGMEMINEERRKRNLELITRRAGFLKSASQAGLGVSRQENIELVEA